MISRLMKDYEGPAFLWIFIGFTVVAGPFSIIPGMCHVFFHATNPVVRSSSNV